MEWEVVPVPPKKSSGGIGAASPAAPSTSSANWISIPASVKDVSNVPEGKVQLIDTMTDALIDGVVNPTGAVAVTKFKDETFCFASSCPSCKIPLTKAKVIEPAKGSSSPRLVCDFCKSVYDIESGTKAVATEEESGKPGLFGGVVKNLFSASTSNDPLKIYALGEKKGKLLINL